LQQSRESSGAANFKQKQYTLGAAPAGQHHAAVRLDLSRCCCCCAASASDAAHHVGLLDAHIIQGWARLSLPLQPMLSVPICLAMPDENQFCCDSHFATHYELRFIVDARFSYQD
jgi:hypothetical protein